MGIKPHALHPRVSLSPQIQRHLTSHHPPVTLHFSVSTTDKKVCFVHIVHHASRIMRLCVCVLCVCGLFALCVHFVPVSCGLHFVFCTLCVFLLHTCVHVLCVCMLHAGVVCGCEFVCAFCMFCEFCCLCVFCACFVCVLFECAS